MSEKSKFTFGAILEQEIGRELEEYKNNLQAQLKLVQETSNNILQQMNKTGQEYDRQAQDKLSKLDTLVNERFATLEAKVMNTLNGLVGRVNTLEAEKNNLTTKMTNMNNIITATKDDMSAMKVRLDQADNIFDAICKAAARK